MLLGILFRKLLGSYAISTADRGGIDLAAAGTLYTNSSLSVRDAHVGGSQIDTPAGSRGFLCHIQLAINLAVADPAFRGAVLAPSLMPSTID